MRFPLSMVIFVVAVTGLGSAARSEEAKAPLSPLQTQLQKMQDGESYGMKSISVPQGSATPGNMPKVTLSDKAKALADKASEAEKPKPPSRLELMQDAYKKAAPPTDAEKAAAAKAPEEKEPKDKEAVAKEAAEKAAQQADQQNEQVMFETIQGDNTPPKPSRLIPVN